YPALVTDLDTCTTFEALDNFRLSNVVGNMNVNNYISPLECKTDRTSSVGMKWMPAFRCMSHQYMFIERMRQVGWGHDPAGRMVAKAGKAMVICWACPYDRFLYMLILAIDTNFKLKNHIQAHEHDDPSLGPGWGPFVEPTVYKEHLQNYVAKNDISMCIAFTALMQKETRNTAGLHVFSVGSCVCAQYECMHPNGLGDPQRGEHYANMDYIVMAALVSFNLIQLTLSYDITCQWKKNLPSCMAKLPARLQLNLNKIECQCGLPVWHALSHKSSCTNENSLSFLKGIAKSDGEGVECLW
ncbi:hypothetical protein B0H10DRAFT_1714216, partial [Mycena sp. CBHHK59/15]